MKEAGLVILKIVFTVVMLPVLVASAVALQRQAFTLSGDLQQALGLGLTSFLILKLFVYDFQALHHLGQGITTFCFRAFKGLAQVAPFVIPLYSVFVLLVYAILQFMGKARGLQYLFFTLLAFTFSMHVVMTAQELYEKDGAYGKPTYFFSMVLITIVDLVVLALVVSAITPAFDFLKFFNDIDRCVGQIYRAVFQQLFGVR